MKHNNRPWKHDMTEADQNAVTAIMDDLEDHIEKPFLRRDQIRRQIRRLGKLFGVEDE